MRRLFLATAVLCVATSVIAGGFFRLEDVRTSTSYGPFNMTKGERVSLNGVTYELIQVTSDRVTFKSLSNGVTYGPLQVVNGRLGVIGNATYRFASAVVVAPPSGTGAASKADTFVPQPPAMPSRIDIPDQPAARVVAPKDLPSLPEDESVFFAFGWLALLDATPLDWKIDSLSGDNGSLERASIGGGIEWNHLFADLALSPSVKCDDIVSGDMGISSASLDDGSGIMLEMGYKRPFLISDCWKVNAGMRGQFRQDKGDINSISSYLVDETDTNGVTSAKMKHKINSSSITIRELSLWLDVELAYVSDGWGAVAGVSIEPVSAYSVSGSIPCGGRDLSIDAERKLPLGFTLGGWYDYERYRFFSDLTFGADRRFRIGCQYGL